MKNLKGSKDVKSINNPYLMKISAKHSTRWYGFFLEIRIFENVIKPILTNGTKNWRWKLLKDWEHCKEKVCAEYYFEWTDNY
jgi:hypothetical protein